MFTVRGWRGAGPDKMPVPSDTLREEEEEVDGNESSDVPAPLPSEQISTGKQHGKQGLGKGTSAKDKRRLREKRRSTGVATLSGHEMLKADELTTRNTSYNETPGVVSDESVKGTSDPSSLPPPPPPPPPPHSTSSNNGQRDDCSASLSSDQQARSSSHANQNQNYNGSAATTTTATTSATHHENCNSDNTVSAEENASVRLKIHDNSENLSSVKSTSDPTSRPPVTSPSSHGAPLSPDFAKHLCARPFEVKRGILKGTSSRPIIAPKPEKSSQFALGQRSNEEARLTSRVLELEALLDAERREKALLEKFLAVRDSRIRELELQVETLNEDLDLADEDYLRLEEENRALARALSALNIE